MGIIKEIFRKIKSRSLGAMGQYNAAFVPVLVDGECVILQTDNVGNLRVTGGPGAVFVVGGPAAQDAAIDNVNWFPVEISYESSAYVIGTAFAPNVPVDADGDVVRPRASRYGVAYNMLVSQNGEHTVQIFGGQQNQGSLAPSEPTYGIPPMVIRRDTPTALEINDRYLPLTSDSNGALWVDANGPAAQDAPVLGNPTMIGFESNAYVKGVNFVDFVSADGDVVRPKASRYGVQYVQIVGQNGSDTVQWYDGQAFVAGQSYGISSFAVRADVPANTVANTTYGPLFTNDAGGMWVAQTPGADRFATGTIPVAGGPGGSGTIEINTQGCATASFYVTSAGWGTSQVSVQGLLADGVTWVAMPYFQQVSGNGVVNFPFAVITANAAGQVHCAGMMKIRLNVSAVNTNPVIGYLEASIADQVGAQMAGKYRGDSASGTTDWGNLVLAVRNDNAANTLSNSDLDYSGIAVDSKGQVFVRFGPASGGPVYAEDTNAADGALGFSTLRVRKDAPGTSSAGADGDWAWPLQSSTGYDLVRAESFDPASSSDRGFEVAPLWSHYFPVVTLATALTIPATAVGVDGAGNPVWTGGDVGPEIPTMGMTRLSVWIDLDINEMTGVRFRALGKHTSADADEYELPIIKPNTAATPYSLTIDGEYVTLAQNIDQKKVITWDVSNSIAYVQIQCGAAVDPGVNSILNSVKYTLGFGA